MNRYQRLKAKLAENDDKIQELRQKLEAIVMRPDSAEAFMARAEVRHLVAFKMQVKMIRSLGYDGSKESGVFMHYEDIGGILQQMTWPEKTTDDAVQP